MPRVSDELRAQQTVLGLRAAPDASDDALKKKNAEVASLLDAAAVRYNAGVRPDLDNLDDLRGVVRYREAEKANAEDAKVLTAPAAWKDKAKGEVTMPIDLAMKAVAAGLKDRKPKPSAVKLDVMPPADPNAVPSLPNAMGGGVRTIIFADPSAPPVPASPAPPVVPPAPAPAPAAPTAPATPAAAVPAPNRPPLLNRP
jgi:hypothetical protein